MRVKEKTKRSLYPFSLRLRMIFFILTVAPATTTQAAASMNAPLVKRSCSAAIRRASLSDLGFKGGSLVRSAISDERETVRVLANRSSIIGEQAVASSGVSRMFRMLIEGDGNPVGMNSSFSTERFPSQVDEVVVAQRRRVKRSKRKSKKSRKTRRQARR